MKTGVIANPTREKMTLVRLLEAAALNPT